LYNHSRALDLATWDSDAVIEWIFGEIGVVYRPKLDGGGTFMAEWFVELLDSRCPNRVFTNTFEWCSGPGFIGCALLEAGLTENLVLADISEDAMACVKQTVDHNPKIKVRVRYYVSDNMKSIPYSGPRNLDSGNG
jgi:methylase of polypeptide subunit release factors